jgi:hypothetical protein
MVPRTIASAGGKMKLIVEMKKQQRIDKPDNHMAALSIKKPPS